MQRVDEGAHAVGRGRPVASRLGRGGQGPGPPPEVGAEAGAVAEAGAEAEAGAGLRRRMRLVRTVVPERVDRHAVPGPYGPDGGVRTRRHPDRSGGHADEVSGAAAGVPHPVDAWLRGAEREGGLGSPCGGLGRDEVQLLHPGIGRAGRPQQARGHDEAGQAACSCLLHEGPLLP